MAEVLAGLLTSAVVGIAKHKLASVIEEKANLLRNFDDDLEEMMAVLESISAVLQDAERRSVKEKVVQLWLKRLKNAALDITDMLEDNEETSNQLTAKMCLPIVCKKISLANRMKSMREELQKINKQFRYFNFTHCGTTTSINHHDDVRETSSSLPDKPIIGRNVEKQEIVNLLYARTNNEETLIVAIYGLGGMGKSTLAQQIYNDVHFKKYDHRLWVYVSRDFNLWKIGSSIISLLPVEGSQQNTHTLEAIKQSIDNHLHGKKVLIILDDLWEERVTELGKLKSMFYHMGKKGSMIDIIVTTRNEGIARKVSTSEPYKLRPLDDDTCWEIIKRASNFEDKPNKERFKQIGLDIAKKCGGMALAAEAVGCLLQSKDLFGWTEIHNSDTWNEYSEDDGTVLPSLKLSYERMLPQLRICFSYCAIFQKGHNIAEDDLIHQWIALEFIKPSMGKEYFRKLLEMSFLQVSKLPLTSGEHGARYTMHDLVHDLATLVAGDEFTSIVTSKRMYKSGNKYCRYALVTKYDQARKFSNILPSKLRALHFSDSTKLDLAREAFSFAKHLRILDFSECSSILLPTSIGKLKHLKYLVAPRIQNEDLPSYITKLSKLQYLNLNGSAQISSLPESFGDLKCLVHLDMSGCSEIRKLPDSLGNLTNLQQLMLSKCSSLQALPDSLCNLTQLQYLNISFCNYIARLPEHIGSLVNLEYLDMSHCGVRELPKSSKMLHNLLHLNLECSSIEKGLPGALSGLTALQYLDLSDYKRVENMEKDDLPVALRNLTSLKVLDLKRSLRQLFDVENNDDYLDFIGSLTNLESLDLRLNAELRYLPESIGNLKRLHTMKLELCEGLQSIPESVACANGLKSLRLYGCSNEVVDKANALVPYSLTLPYFKVRSDNTSKHSNLHLLEGVDIDELHICCLANVRTLQEAQSLKLLKKQNLLRLTLDWSQGDDRFQNFTWDLIMDGDKLLDDDLLGQLVPPTTLKSMTLRGYCVPRFPSWVLDISQHLPNLTSITLINLYTCCHLPPLGQLPYLEELWISAAPNIQNIDSSICGGKRAFPRLARFSVCCMATLAEWDTTFPGEDGVDTFMFPMLDVLQVIDCPRLKLKPGPPRCRQSMIAVCDQVISSLEEIGISSSHHSSSTETTRLTIIYSQSLSFRLFHHFPALHELDFCSCQNLTSLPEGIQQLSSLKSLELEKCDNISALPEWMGDISSLKRLVIKGCKGIKSLPSCVQQLTCLQNLHIRGNLELQQWCESEENKAKLTHIDDISYGLSVA